MINNFSSKNIRLDILAISTSCATSVNRNIYIKFLNNGYSIELVSPKYIRIGSVVKIAEAERPQDPKIHFLPLIGINPRIFYFKKLENLIYLKKPKVIILDNDPASFLTLRIGLICYFLKIRLYNFSYENIPYNFKNTFQRVGFYGLLKYILKLIFLKINKGFVSGLFVTNNIGFQIFSINRYRNVNIIPLGFEPKDFFPNYNSRINIRFKYNLDGIIISYFGRLCFEKGVHVLISALSDLTNLSWTLILDEFKDYSDSYVKIIQKEILENGLANRVVFVNPTHNNISDYMNASDVIVIPSVSTNTWSEQFGRVAVEGLACGKLVIASNSGFLPYIIKDKGILFEQNNVFELRNYLRNFIIDYDMSKEVGLSMDRHLYAQKNFSLDIQYNLMKNIIN